MKNCKNIFHQNETKNKKVSSLVGGV